MMKIAIVTLCGGCHHAESYHSRDGCLGGEDTPCPCESYWPEGEDEE